jgi:putative membrane protein insertion efficiency factor
MVLLRLPRLAALGLIRVYQNTLGPALPPACRFQPTCSAYAYAAIERHGLLRGGWLALRRLGRCHPWNPGGVDPVPPKARVASPSQPGGPPSERSTNPAAATVADHRPPRRAA